MAKKPERTFRNGVTRHISGLYIWSINDNYSRGVPDHYYSGNADDLWAEYKFFPCLKEYFDLTRPPKSPKMSRNQQEWCNSRYDEGRNVWVIVGFPQGGVILQDKEWMHPYHVGKVLTRKEIAEEIMDLCDSFLM